MMAEYQSYKCVMCNELFNPPHNLPYLMPCTHSLCTNCLQHVIANKQSKIICPSDLQSNLISEIKFNSPTRKALERLLQQHKNFSQNNQLLCIQSLSKHFEQMLLQKQEEKIEFKQLLEKIFRDEGRRLQELQQRINKELNSPFAIVQEWKEILRNYLSSLKHIDRSHQASSITKELNYYIEEGRKIKQELAEYQRIQLEGIINSIIANPKMCLQNNFSIRGWKSSMEENYKSVVKEKSEKVRSVTEVKVKGVPEAKVKTEKFNNTELMFDKISTVKPAELYPDSSINFDSYKQQRKQDCYKPQSNEKDTNSDQYEVKTGVKISRNDYNSQRIKGLQSGAKTEKKVLSQITDELNLASHYNASGRDNKQLLMYSPDFDRSFHKMAALHEQDDDLLLTQKNTSKGWARGNFNFLQKWEISHEQPVEEIPTKKRDLYNCQRQKNNYIRRMELLKAEEARHQTSLSHNCLQLINYSLQDVDIQLFLEAFDWNDIEVVKLVKTNMSDSQLNQILNFTLHSKVSTLVLCGNCLSESSLDALLNFIKLNSMLRNVYLSKNSINCLKGNSRAKVCKLRELGLNLYI